MKRLNLELGAEETVISENPESVSSDSGHTYSDVSSNTKPKSGTRKLIQRMVVAEMKLADESLWLRLILRSLNLSSF